MLTLIAAPFLVLFGTGLVTDDEIALSTRLIMAPIYILGVCVAPVVLWRSLIRRGTAWNDAFAAAVALAVVGLALELTLLSNVMLLAQLALVVVVLVWDRTSRKGTAPGPGSSLGQ
jgi:hypothetical protein